MTYELSDDTYIPRFPNRSMNKEPEFPLSKEDIKLYLSQPFSDETNIFHVKQLKEIVFRHYFNRKTKVKKGVEEKSLTIKSFYGILKDPLFYTKTTTLIMSTYLSSRQKLPFEFKLIKVMVPNITDEKFFKLIEESEYEASFRILRLGWNKIDKENQDNILGEFCKKQNIEESDFSYLIDTLLNTIHHDKDTYFELFRTALEFCCVESRSLTINKKINKDPNVNFELERYNILLIDKKNKFPSYKVLIPSAKTFLEWNETRVFDENCQLYYDGTIRKYCYNAYQRRFGTSGSSYYGASYESDEDIRQEGEEFLHTIMKKFDKKIFLKKIVENIEESREGKDEPKTLHWILRSFISMRVKWSAQETETWLKTTQKKSGSTQFNVVSEDSHEGNFSKYNYENEASGFYFQALEAMTPKERKFVKECLEIGTPKSELRKKYKDSFDDLNKFYLSFKKKFLKHEESYSLEKGREIFIEKDDIDFTPLEIKEFLEKGENPFSLGELNSSIKESTKRINKVLKTLKKSHNKKFTDLTSAKESLKEFKKIVTCRDIGMHSVFEMKISERKENYELLELALKSLKIKKTDTYAKIINITDKTLTKAILANTPILNSLKKDNPSLFDSGDKEGVLVIVEDYMSHIKNLLDSMASASVLKYFIDEKKYDILERIMDRRDCFKDLMNYKIVNNENFIHYVVRSDDFRMLSLILKEEKVEIDAQNSEGETALHIAVQLGNDDMARTLLSKGANAGIMDNKNKFPLDYK